MKKINNEILKDKSTPSVTREVATGYLTAKEECILELAKMAYGLGTREPEVCVQIAKNILYFIKKGGD